MFPKDVGRGNIGERKVIEVLSVVGPTVKVHHSTNNHDIELTFQDKVIKIEVKSDFYAKRSGNLAIEFHNSKSDKPSGIAATEADLWVHFFLDELYITTVKKLRQFCKRSKPLKTVIAKGDFNSNMHIYKIEDIVKIFTKIDAENAEEVLLKLV